MFALMTLAALVIYCVPIKCKATCDYTDALYYPTSSTNNLVDIQGRLLYRHHSKPLHGTRDW